MDNSKRKYFDENLLSRFKDIRIKPTESNILGALGFNGMISTQSFLIRCGFVYERFWNNIISNTPNTENLIEVDNTIAMPGTTTYKRKKTKKRQLDHLFRIHNDLYYRESKCNLNFDSEKGPASEAKIKDIKGLLSKKYNIPANNISVGYFCPVVPVVPIHIRNKAPLITTQDGIDDMINILGYVPFTSDDYFEYHRTILAEYVAEKMQFRIDTK